MNIADKYQLGETVWFDLPETNSNEWYFHYFDGKIEGRVVYNDGRLALIEFPNFESLDKWGEYSVYRDEIPLVIPGFDVGEAYYSQFYICIHLASGGFYAKRGGLHSGLLYVADCGSDDEIRGYSPVNSIWVRVGDIASQRAELIVNGWGWGDTRIDEVIPFDPHRAEDGEMPNSTGRFSILRPI